MTKSIQEYLANVLSEAHKDRKNLKINGICVIARESSNGRIYSDPALDDIVHLILENGRCFIDHRDPEDEKKGRARPVKELLGKFENPRREGQKVFADLNVLPHQEQMFFGIAEMMPDVVGMSIDGEASISPMDAENEMDLVERVTRLISTDLVSTPATTKSLFESDPSGGDNDKEEKLKEQKVRNILLKLLAGYGVDTSALHEADEETLQKAVDVHLAKIAEEDKTSAVEKLTQEIETLKGSIKTQEDKIEELEGKLDTFKAKEEQEKALETAMAAIEEAGIPKRLVSEVFIRTVVNTEDEDERKALIDERKAIAESTKEEIDLGSSREEREARESEEKDKDVSDDEWADKFRS